MIKTARHQGHFSSRKCPVVQLLYSVLFLFFLFCFSFFVLIRFHEASKKKYLLCKLFLDGHLASNVTICACKTNPCGKKSSVRNLGPVYMEVGDPR